MDVVKARAPTYKTLALGLILSLTVFADLLGQVETASKTAVTGPQGVVAWNRRTGESLRLQSVPGRALVRLAVSPSSLELGN